MSSDSTTIYDTATVTQWLDNMIDPLRELISGGPPAAMIGIRRGGVDVGRYLHNTLREDCQTLCEEMGELNIAFYRDDFSSVGLHPVVGPSHVPFDVTEQHIILVDDVLGTGRTVRAAMNEIFDYGRPSKITLAVLAQRADHELPIRADVVGKQLDVAGKEYIDLDGERLQVTVGVTS